MSDAVSKLLIGCSQGSQFRNLMLHPGVVTEENAAAMLMTVSLQRLMGQASGVALLKILRGHPLLQASTGHHC